MLLDKIVANKKREIEILKRRRPVSELKRLGAERPHSVISFRKQLQSSGKRAKLICEMKKASPSEGLMRRVYLPRKIAAIYERAGGSAISVLTDQKYFKGSIHTIRHIKAVTKLPVLRKDFLVDDYQIYESAAFGADAILLIVAILSDQELARLLKLAKKLRLDALVEAHNESEVKRAVRAGANLIGINNRNLDTLSINSKHAETLMKLIPKNVTIVVESGIHTRKDIERYQKLGAHAFLVGTAFMKAPDISKKMRELIGNHGTAV